MNGQYHLIKMKHTALVHAISGISRGGPTKLMISNDLTLLLMNFKGHTVEVFFHFNFKIASFLSMNLLRSAYS